MSENSFKNQVILVVISTILALLSAIIFYYFEKYDSSRKQEQTHPVKEQNNSYTLPLTADIKYFYRKKGQLGSLSRLYKGEVLYTGDIYQVAFSTNQDSYVYIFQIDATGQVDRLYPLQKWGSIQLNHRNPIRGGTSYYTPTVDASFELGGQAGVEKLYFISFKDRQSHLERNIVNINDIKYYNPENCKHTCLVHSLEFNHL